MLRFVGNYDFVVISNYPFAIKSIVYCIMSFVQKYVSVPEHISGFLQE